MDRRHCASYIVSEKPDGGNIAEMDCCGEAVETRDDPRRQEENRRLWSNRKVGIELL
jgi:hypothetical protein